MMFLSKSFENSSLRDPLLEEEAVLQSQLRSPQRSRPSLRSFLTHIGIAICYTAAITALVVPSSHSGTSYATSYYSPAQEAMKYEMIPFNARPDTIYTGDPSEEGDQAWRELLKNSHIRLSGEELRKLNRTSLELKDGGYAAELGVYHELHCVKWIRMWMYREHYWPYLEGWLYRERAGHIDHCLEILRLGAMCRGSIDITTFEWIGSEPTAVPPAERQCVPWEALDGWSASRQITFSDLNVFKDRPKTEDWEVLDHNVRLGAVQGQTDKFKAFLGGAFEGNNDGHGGK